MDKVSKILGISKHTLRYYDKLELVNPKRNNNEYRYYTKKELYDFKYIQILKYSGFSLKKIKIIITSSYNMESFTSECCAETEFMILNKKIEQQIKYFRSVIKLFDKTLYLIQDVKAETPEICNDAIIKIYEEIKEGIV